MGDLNRMRDDSTLLAEPPLTPATPRAVAPPRRSPWTRRRLVAVTIGYVVGLGGMVLVKGLFISPDRYFLILLVPAVVLGVGRAYARDFLPFIVGVLLYEQARGVAHWLNPRPFYEPMISVDRFLFDGRVPPVELQRLLWSGHLQWYDQLIMLVDRAHFFVPPTLLFFIWLDNRALFYRCALTLVAVSFAGALTFLVFPAAPPWLAAKHGLIGQITQIGYVQAAHSPVSTARSWIDSAVLPNPVAAVPSLHTAYSFLTMIFAFAWRRRVGYAFLAYPVVMWFTIVYVGDHYVTDIIVGVVYALAGWLLIGRAFRRGGRLSPLAGPFQQPLAAARPFGGSPR